MNNMEKTVVEFKAEAYDIFAKIQAHAAEIERLKAQLQQLNEKIHSKSLKTE